MRRLVAAAVHAAVVAARERKARIAELEPNDLPLR
jgi:hypothetical protein